MAQRTTSTSDEETIAEEDRVPGITYISRREGSELLDRQARKYLGMSGEEFKRQYRAGLLDGEDSRVIRLSFIIPLAED